MLFPLETSPAQDTPMMAQYKAIKSAHPDCLLFYRMGDFYELFFEDAITASKILDITLTRRGKNDGQDIPMCGVPFHSCDPYIAKLIKAGQRVAICEQAETPEQAKKRGGSKALVRRDVVRIITSGTLTEDHLLNAKTHNFLACIVEDKDICAVSWCDVSTGRLYAQSLIAQDIPALLMSLQPSEILIPDTAKTENLSEFAEALNRQPALLFDQHTASQDVCRHYHVADASSFGDFTILELTAIASLLKYLTRTQKTDHIALNRPEKIISHNVMLIDPATQKSLELLRSQNHERQGSLLAAIDRTLTTAGARLLQSRLSAPLCDTTQINQRLNDVESFAQNTSVREKIRHVLDKIPDMERSLMRLALNRGGPRDLHALKVGLRSCVTLREILIESDKNNYLGFIEMLGLTQAQHSFVDELDILLLDNLPMLARDGGFVKTGYSPQLDHLKNLKENSRKEIASLQNKYMRDTGIESLKITHNNILGFFIEVPSKRAERLLVPANNNSESLPFIHRQTMANAVRFTTAELVELERDVASAAEKSLALELDIFEEQRRKTLDLREEILRCAQAVADLDVATSLAHLAVEQNYTRPQIDASLTFRIEKGRHPVVEQALQLHAQNFHANDTNLSHPKNLWVLTGPNMAGKSTFLRQNALIAILAHVGSFVPAKLAHIGVIDKIFSRVGAADDLARGRSTFMVEMIETATILNQATEKSLVILDEIGRGTSTYDGLSIAWACLEYLHNKIKCRGLFATHYHELTALEKTLSHLSCHSMQVKEWDHKIIFLHSVAKGAADRSYGIHVAQLAGLPSDVTQRAQMILQDLESRKDTPSIAVEALRVAPSPSPHPALDELRKIELDNLSPKDALDRLYALKKLLN
jgi:DNA mismatch repair protein MutS